MAARTVFQAGILRRAAGSPFTALGLPMFGQLEKFSEIHQHTVTARSPHPSSSVRHRPSSSHRPMELEKLGDCFGIAPTHAALSADTKIVNCSFSGLDTLACSVDSIA
jgi:hypothetical protein